METLAENRDMTMIIVSILDRIRDVKALMQTCKSWNAAIGAWAENQGSDLDKIQLLPTYTSAVPVVMHINSKTLKPATVDIIRRCNGHTHNRRLHLGMLYLSDPKVSEEEQRQGFIKRFGGVLGNQIWSAPVLLRNWAYEILQKRVAQNDPLDPFLPMFLEPIRACLEHHPSAETLEIQDARFLTLSPLDPRAFLSKYHRSVRGTIDIKVPNVFCQIHLNCNSRDWEELIETLKRRPVSVRDSEISILWP